MRRREFLRLTVGTLFAAPLQGASRNLRIKQEEEEAILATAKERIRKYRQKLVTFHIRQSHGQPIQHARVRLHQTRHAFLFGCNLFRWGRIRDPKREELYRQRFAALLNYATLPFYWRSYEPQPGKPQYAYTEAVAAWCQKHGITCKGHPLVWDHPAGSPTWLPEDLQQVQTLSIRRVRSIVSHFANQIQIWDVVNEPTDLGRFHTTMNRFARSLGAVRYTKIHLQTARQANPKALLLVNDYRTDQAYLQILQKLKDENGKFLFDVIGIQSHMHGGPWPVRRVWKVCQRFAQLQVPLHFTETTIVSGPRIGRKWQSTTPEGEEKQAEATVRFYTILFSHPAVEAITWWDFSDDGAWQGAPAGWLRRDMSPKPVYERMIELIKKKWWTCAEGVTDSNGQWTVSAFLGEYSLVIETESGQRWSQSISIQRSTPSHIKITLS